MTNAIDDAIDYLDRLIERLSASSDPTKSFPQSLNLSSGSNTDVSKNRSCKNANDRKSASKTPTNNLETGARINSEQEEMFAKAEIQVGYVQHVTDHSMSEKLYLCKVEVANGVIRQVVAGLRKFLPASELQGKKVCVVVNLKPAKLAGQISEAMILAGEATDPSGQVLVKALEAPLDATIGERILIEGSEVMANPVRQLSSKVWEKIVSLLKVEGELAKFDGRTLRTTTGHIKVPGLLNGSIH
eukprot:TRINITY_DN2202_c0_g1_i1.p1 TRINITY_DN2202_c0_g1~~TRINITY_DN2202_c0_g1_i1.p1  ORF type:complete len:244 (-),score=42.64 TRINITY_DN2202_c0_g1_i1:394-1125(-)